MLAKLGRWLRTAGYDTKIAANALPDREMLENAIQENRLLISRDRKLAEFKIATNVVILLECKDFRECVEELTRKLHVNWLKNPFSRCIKCNAELVLADVTQLRKVPDDFKKSAGRLWYCQQCDQVYWPGGHVKRMKRQLEAFKDIQID